MKNYLNEQPAGMIIGNSVKIYLSNFKTLFLIYFIPALPTLLLYEYAKITDEGEGAFIVIAYAIHFMLTFLIGLPVAVAVSDISLGNRPTVGRSYRCVYSKGVGSILITYFLLILVIVGSILITYFFLMLVIPDGFIFYILVLALVPGILFLLWYTLTMQVVLLERLSGWKALKRSKELGKDFYWRNIGVIIFINFICITLLALLSVFFKIAPDDPARLAMGHHIVSFVGGAVALLFGPPTLIVPVLIYYDMRARKEAYDIRTLTEDLTR